MSKLFACSICGDVVEDWPNNAWPINAGKCCDWCNWQKVLPARLRNWRDSTSREPLRGIVHDAARTANNRARRRAVNGGTRKDSLSAAAARVTRIVRN